MSDVQNAVQSLLDALGSLEPGERLEAIQEARRALAGVSPMKSQPVDLVQWVPVESVSANDYNPNRVATTEMRLLYTSIAADGYTQPVVVVPGDAPGTYVIVDGFHRYWTLRSNKEIQERTGGRVPVVVLNKSMADRMASTVRHNRARGAHTIKGMSSLVFGMMSEGRTDAEICNELGMEPQELLRLKHITGFAKLFNSGEYSKSWRTVGMIRGGDTNGA